jgi:hypothetical protein
VVVEVEVEPVLEGGGDDGVGIDIIEALAAGAYPPYADGE